MTRKQAAAIRRLRRAIEVAEDMLVVLRESPLIEIPSMQRTVAALRHVKEQHDAFLAAACTAAETLRAAGIDIEGQQYTCLSSEGKVGNSTDDESGDDPPPRGRA